MYYEISTFKNGKYITSLSA